VAVFFVRSGAAKARASLTKVKAAKLEPCEFTFLS
jgi:hypothetical protein